MTWMGPPLDAVVSGPTSLCVSRKCKAESWDSQGTHRSPPPPPPPGLHAIISSVANPFPHHSCLLRDGLLGQPQIVCSPLE